MTDLMTAEQKAAQVRTMEERAADLASEVDRCIWSSDGGYGMDYEAAREHIMKALTAVRNEALEEAAQKIENAHGYDEYDPHGYFANMIRALKTTSGDDEHG